MTRRFQNISKKKFNIIFAIVLVLAALASVGISILTQTDFIPVFKTNVKMKNAVEFSVSGQELKENEHEGIEYLDDGSIITTTNDPMIYYNANGNYVKTLQVEFSQPLNTALNITVYYTAAPGEDLSEERIVSQVAHAGDTQCLLFLPGSSIYTLRIDIGQDAGISYSLDGISFNKVPEGGFWKQYFDNFPIYKVVLFSELFMLAFVFALLHIFFLIKPLYEKIYRFRWIIAACALIFCTANRLNGDSLAVYDQLVQPNSGSEYVEPVIGEERSIRSDEFLVESPSKLAASFSDEPFGLYNNIQRGTKTVNLYGAYLNPLEIARAPFMLGFGFLPLEYAYSFSWYGPIILLFMVSFELCYLIARKRKILSFAGACLIGLSPFYLWWSLPSFILWAQASILCIYYFIKLRKTLGKIICAAGFGISFANFVLYLYPAWIVPMAYVALAFIIWIIHENKRDFKALRWFHFLIFALGVCLAGLLVLLYLRSISDYVTAISNTVYPGERHDAGGYGLPFIFNYFRTYMYGISDIGNASEFSAILSFFPIPLIAGLITLVKSKKKKKDWLIILLLIVNAVFIIFCTAGFPLALAKISLLSRSTAVRVVPILALTQVYLMMRVLSRKENKRLLHPVIAAAIGVVTAVIAYKYCESTAPGYLSLFWTVVSFAVIIVFSLVLLSSSKERSKNILAGVLAVISIVTAFTIRPVSIGLDAIYSKPVAQEIQRIVKEDPDADWIAYGGGYLLSGYSVACGAPTINSTNIYPNMELWTELDPEGKYEDVYNRYAHVNVVFVEDETSFELNLDDAMTVYINYDDLEKIGCRYVLSVVPLDGGDGSSIQFDQIYSEDSIYIYEVVDTASLA